MSKSFPIFIGWTPGEIPAYEVAMRSLLRHCSTDVQVQPLVLADVQQNLLTRPVERKDGKLWCPVSDAPMATEFAISRFCVPFLCRMGWALFVDCDVLFRADVAELFALADERYAVMVVKHTQVPIEQTKMNGQVQTVYPRKNWSSVMLWNCSHPVNTRLTLQALNTWPGRDLHAFKWLDDSEIGELPPEWNYLVGVSPEMKEPKLVHYTLGSPDLPGYETCQFADEWRSYLPNDETIHSNG